MMTKKPTIFIASSGRALLLAEQLKLGLELSKVFEDVLVWEQEIREDSGTTIVDFLKDAARKSDFAAVVLTGDDATLANYKNADSDAGNRVLKPRDNCIFEAGLFTGALELDFGRCFLVSAVEGTALPTDLQPLQQIRFKEPDLKNENACMEEMKRSVIPSIKIKVQRKGCIDRRPAVPIVTGDDILDEERKPANLADGLVVVNATEPLEKDYAFALRVMENMRENNVEYSYFFHGDPEGVRSVWAMIQMLSLAGLASEFKNFKPGSTPSKDLVRRLEGEQESIDKMFANLNTIKRKLSVHFLPCAVPIEFCVHSANNYARSYLRYGIKESQLIEWDGSFSTEVKTIKEVQFIEWHRNNKNSARAIAQEVKKQCLKKHEQVVFRSTEAFLLTEQTEFSNRLVGEMDGYFQPEAGIVRAKVEEVCFEEGLRKVA
jgi:predicted nucleotide-binding protein